MNKKNGFWKGALCGALVMLVLSVAVIGGRNLVSGIFATSTGVSGVIDSTTKDKLTKIRTLIDKHFLHDIDEDSLTNGIFAGYVAGLDDPYSVYYNEEETKALLESTSGEYSGIGAVLSQDKDTGVITIVNVFDQAPAKEAGMKAEDLVKSVDGKEVTGKDLTKVVSDIKGKEGTTVKITVVRGSENKEIDLTITRRKVETQTVSYEMKENKIGYIRVTEFDSVTYDQFAKALDDLNSQDMQGLVIDLRNNPGGNLATVCDMLRQVLPKGLIVYTKDRDGNKEEFKSDGANEFDKPLTVLVNGYSASASEIFAGAVQDYGIGKIVGTTTYGKGVVQQLFDLNDGTFVKITISEYFTPKGRNIDGKGIEPDEVVEFTQNENDENADNQLDRAMEIIQNELK